MSESNKNAVKKQRFKEVLDYAEDAIVSKKIMANKGGNVSLFAFDKGQVLSEHTAPFDALVQVLDGEAEIIIDSKVYLLSENESIVMPANVPHALRATEKFKMLLTMLKE